MITLIDRAADELAVQLDTSMIRTADPDARQLYGHIRIAGDWAGVLRRHAQGNPERAEVAAEVLVLLGIAQMRLESLR